MRDRRYQLFMRKCGMYFMTVLLLTIMGAAISRAGNPAVKIGVLAKRGRDQCLEKWSPTAAYLSERISTPFIIVPLKFVDIHTAVENGSIDFILANPSFYVELEIRYGVSRIATLKNRHSSGAFYTRFGGVIFCRADRADIQQLSDLKGKSFSAVKETSFGGFQMAWWELKKSGIDPYRHFKPLQFAGTHDAVVFAVRDGKAAAGTVRTDTLERMRQERKIDLDQFKIINRQDQVATNLPFLCSTRVYPEWPMAELRHVPDELAEKVAVALIDMPPDSPAAVSSKSGGWTIPYHYQPVEDCLKELRVGPYKDLGKVTLSDVIRNFWRWLLGMAGAFILMGVTIAVFLKMNRNIRSAHRNLEKEVAQRRKTENALMESENRVRTILDTVNTGILVIDPESFQIVDVNPVALELIGESREAVLGSHCHTYICPNEDWKCPIVDLGQDVDNTERILMTKGGAKVPILKSVAPVMIKGKKLLLESFVDITERKLTEEKLKRYSDHLEDLVKERTLEIKKSEKKFRELSDLLPLIVFEMDMAGNITYTNRLGFDYTGYTREEYEAGVNVFQFVASEDHERIQQQLLRMLEGEEGKPYEYTLVRKDGTRFPFIIYSSLIVEKGRPAGLRGAVVDISDIKRTEAKLIGAREAAEAANRAKSDFLSNMSHELRTPMNAINGMTHLCFLTELTEQQKGYLKKLDNAGRALMGLIGDILDFSKIEGGDLEIAPRAFGAKKLLENIKITYSTMAREKRLYFDMAVSSEIPAKLVGDETRLHKILSNLLDNAIKFTDEGGVTLRVRAEGMKHGTLSGISDEKSGIDPAFKIQHSKFRMSFEVEDTGIGMTQDQISQLFKPFTQLDGSSTRKYGGTGLGLSLTKRLVEMMEGEIEVVSEKGKGSTFSFAAVFASVSEDTVSEPEDAGSVEAAETTPDATRVEADITAPPDVSVMAPKLAELSDLIRDDDTRAIRKFGEIKDDLTMPAISEDAAILEKALGEYDFEDALAALGRIMDQIEMQE